MKIICILHYTLEDYYNAQSVIPLEYSSIEDLQAYVDSVKAQFSSYVAERNRISRAHCDVTQSDRYKALQTSASIVAKALRIQRNSFSRDKRDAEWKKKLRELEREEARIMSDMNSMTENLEKIPHNDNALTICGKHIMYLSEYEYESSKKSLEFYTLEDWFEKNKNK